VKFKALLIQDGDIIDTFELDVAHDEKTEGSSVFLQQKAVSEAFDALKGRAVAKRNSRVKDYISKTVKATRLMNKLMKKEHEKGEGAVTPKELQEVEHASGEMYSTDITIDVEPA
jgi:hypothetical protein